MKNIFKVIFFSAIICALSSCETTSNLTMGEKYSSYYEEAPLSLIIMPPINKTTNVDAKEYFYTTLNYKLAEKGYYVMPPIMTMDILRQESAYDAELLLDRDLTLFNTMLGADVCVFTIIKDWRKDAILTDTISIGIEYIFKSTKTNRVLYHKEGHITYSYNNTSSYSGLEALVSIVVDKVSAALTDYIEVAHDVNEVALSEMPVGKYYGDALEDEKAVPVDSYDKFDIILRK